ncbi:MAG: hypothetical protein ABIA76_02010 [Candidatus Diapherotrites archaeon]
MNERTVSWTEELSEEDFILNRIVYSKDFKKVEKFAVIYETKTGTKIKEAIKFDCGKTEPLHIHNFKTNEKRYLNKEKSFETIEELTEQIRKNWKTYKLKFFER